MVELFSITFLFVTILFLGAGEFVERGVLGTLLGTVAGYVFTRRNNSPTSDSDASDLPEAPPMPVLDATRTILSVGQFPTNAMYISAYYRQVGSATDILLGSSTNTNISFPTLTLTAGSQYEFWVTATNGSGRGQPSPKLIVTGP